jgi:hypothetical protein
MNAKASRALNIHAAAEETTCEIPPCQPSPHTQNIVEGNHSLLASVGHEHGTWSSELGKQ